MTDGEVLTDAEVLDADTTTLVITSEQPGGEIVANFEAVRARIAHILEDYTDITFDARYVPLAKRDRAYLRSVSAELNQRRKEVKQRYMAPIARFEALVKELDAPIKEAADAIDVQVKEYEARAKAEKREAIRQHWLDFAGALAEVVSFEQIEDERWVLRSVSLPQAFDAVEAAAARIARDERTLDDLALAYAADAKSEYFATLDMSRAIARSKQLEERAAKQAAFEAEQAEAKRWREEQAAKPEPEPVVAPEPEAAPEATTEVAREWTFTTTCTRAQLDNVLAYMRSIGLTGVVRS